MKLLQVTGLRKSFRTRVGELEVLCGIDIEVEEAEMVAIVGASGVGKSTLLHILGTLDRPTRGKVCYRGEDVFALGEGPLSRFRNREIGFVFQFHHLLPEFTALENVMMPGLISELELDEVKSRASGLLDELGLSERMHHRPGKLSGGEQQRVAIARALVMEPLMVLADEPTGNLDTKTGGRLFNIIEDINRKKGTTFMIVTHNDSLATRCSRIVRMVDGRIVSG